MEKDSQDNRLRYNRGINRIAMWLTCQLKGSMFGLPRLRRFNLIFNEKTIASENCSRKQTGKCELICRRHANMINSEKHGKLC